MSDSPAEVQDELLAAQMPALYRQLRVFCDEHAATSGLDAEAVYEHCKARFDHAVALHAELALRRLEGASLH